MYGSLRKARGTPMPRSEFERALGAAEHRAGRAAVELARTRRLLEREDMAGAFGAAFAFSAEVEKLALLARVLPAYTGHPKAAELKEQMLMDTIPVEMGYAKRGWFRLQIPALLPKKESGSPISHPAVSLPGAAALFCWKAAGSLSKLRAGLPPCVLSGTSGACLSGPR